MNAYVSIPPTENLSRPGFTSAKANRIPYKARWHRTAMVQLSLRDDVRSFRLAATSAQIATDLALEVDLIDCTRTVTLVESRTRTVANDYPVMLPNELCRTDTFISPLRENANLLWRSRSFQINFADRMRVLQAVQNSPTGKSITSCAALICQGTPDAMETIATLVCDGLLTLDLTVPISPLTHLKPGIFLSPSGEKVANATNQIEGYQFR